MRTPENLDCEVIVKVKVLGFIHVKVIVKENFNVKAIGFIIVRVKVNFKVKVINFVIVKVKADFKIHLD